MRNVTLNELRLREIGVKTCELTQSTYRAACCDLLLDVNARNRSSALATFRKQGEFGDFSGLRISGITDLSFLKEFPKLLYLEILGPSPINMRYLDSLTNLRGLRVELPGCGIDFACFPELEVFIGDWHIDNCNLDKSRELRYLHVWHFKSRSDDLSELANITRLEHLAMAQSAIRTLRGLETLEDLRRLAISHVPNLESIDALGNSECGLREVQFSTAKKIKSYAPLARIPKLRRLMLSSCAPMQNLKWTAGMEYLDFFSFVETNVVGADLSPLLDLPKLQYVGTLNKRRYNYTADALNRILQERELPDNGAKRSASRKRS